MPTDRPLYPSPNRPHGAALAATVSLLLAVGTAEVRAGVTQPPSRVDTSAEKARPTSAASTPSSVAAAIDPQQIVTSDVNLAATANIYKDGESLLVDGASDGNTGVGRRALSAANPGAGNTAVGVDALSSGSAGNNVAIGTEALLFLNAGGGNVAIGRKALRNVVSGEFNIAIGESAGTNLTAADSSNILIDNLGEAGDDSTIRIGFPGQHSRAFVEGIRGRTTGVADAVTVVVDSEGQLGTVSSSVRYKEDIRPIADGSDRLHGLRPVAFRYKTPSADGSKPVRYGLIAEEVAEVLPELVVYDRDGQPETVMYRLLTPMLLNELQRQGTALRDQGARMARQEAELAQLRAALASLLADRTAPGAP